MTAIHESEKDAALQEVSKAIADGESLRAEQLAAAYLSDHPDSLAALTLKAEAAVSRRLYEQAEPILRTVLFRAPQFQSARKLLIESLIQQVKFKEALAVLRSSANPESPGNLKAIATVQSDSGDIAGAAATMERLLELDDSSARRWIDYGGFLRFLGHKVESRLAYQRALHRAPGDGRAWWNIVDLDARAVTDDDVTAMEQALAGTDDKEERVSFHFALGAVCDARSNYAAAMQHFRQGNSLRSELNPYNPDKLTRYVDRWLDLATPREFPPRKADPAAASGPIFIVGMPRSGSTMVERILGCHSAIESLGELPIVMNLVNALRANDRSTSPPLQVTKMSTRRLRELGQRYLDRAGEMRLSQSRYFTDKMHMNWRHIPLILKILPNARFIDVRRGALDCCWSNYKVLFAKGHGAASDLAHIGRFFTDYVRLTDHMQHLAPDRILTVSYEQVVDDIEGETRRMLDFLGLEFEPQCLDFHLSTGKVATASSEQVRRPLNREGIGAWRPYRQWLGPLIEALGPLAEPELAEADRT